MKPKFRTNLSFIIAQAQKPPKVTGGKLLSLNFVTFLEVRVGDSWQSFNFNNFFLKNLLTQVLKAVYSMLTFFSEVASV